MTVGRGAAAGPTGQLKRVGVMVASQAINSEQSSSGDLGVELHPGREGVLLIYKPFCSLVNTNKTVGAITNSTGSIIYEHQEDMLQAHGFFGIPSRPEQG